MLRVLVLESNEIERLSIKHVCERLSEYGQKISVTFANRNDPELKNYKPIAIFLDLEDKDLAPSLKEYFPNACVIGILYQRLHKGLNSMPEGFDGLIARENLSPLTVLPWIKLGSERANFSLLNLSLGILNKANEALKAASQDFREITEKSDGSSKESFEIL